MLLDPLFEEELQEDFRSIEIKVSGRGRVLCGEFGSRTEEFGLDKKVRVSSVNGEPLLFTGTFLGEEFAKRKTDFQE